MILDGLTSLRFRGLVCPCLLSDNETVARSSEGAISELCHRVRWHRATADDDSTLSKGLGGFFAGLVPTTTTSSESESEPTVVDATLRVTDRIFVLGGPGPSSSGVAVEIVADETGETSRIPLAQIADVRAVGNVGPSWTQVSGGGGSAPHVIAMYGKTDHELLRIEITNNNGSGSGSTTVGPMGTTCDDIVDHWKNLLEWDRARRRQNGETTEDADDANLEGGSTNTKGSLRGKAEKVAHFAKREIELQQTRREREKRKAKYLEGAGGLKYTALAMANRAG